MVSQKYHTPFCAKNCKIEHHDLVTVLCLDSSQKSDELPELLRECIESYRNWDHNSEVPDPLEDLRCPLIYLAASFGKAGLVKALLQENFDARAVTSTGETALHGAVQYVYLTGSLKSRSLKVAATLGPIKNRRRAFVQILDALTEADPKIIFVQDNDGNTVFHDTAENIWNDRENDRLGKSAMFFQSCMSSLINRCLELEKAGDLTREEILDLLNMQNSDGDTIFHIMARDYAYGFKTMKQILKKFFPGQVPTKVNNENLTVATIALERNRKKAMQAFPEFLEQSRRESRISITSESEVSDGESPTPSTSRDSEKFVTPVETQPETSRTEPPVIVISDTDCVPQVTHDEVPQGTHDDVPQVTHDEEDNSSNEVIAASKETVTTFSERVEASTAPLPTNPGQHDLLTVSIDSNLPGKPYQMDVPSFLSLSQKSTPFDSLISAPVSAEVMYVSETVTTTQHSGSEIGDKLGGAFKRLEVSDTQNNPSDPIAPFAMTISSSDSKVVGDSSKDSSEVPPSEERIAMAPEDSASLEVSEPENAVTDSTADSNNSDDPCQVQSSGAEASQRTETTQTGVFAISEPCDAQVTHSNFISLDAHRTQTPAISEGRSDDVSFNQQVPQTSRGKTVDLSRAKAACGSLVRDLFDPLRKQIPTTSEYTQMYTYGMLDTPVLSSQYPPKVAHDGASVHESTSFTSLASASTESIHSETLEPLDVSSGASDERSTILKCITDNSFLEFLITEGLELDARSKQGVVDVVLSQYSSKLNRVETTIPRLTAQIKDTETTIGQQKEKVKQLQDELEFVKGEIVKNENLLRGFINEEHVMSKQRKALKRKVARCESTMKHLLGSAKKARLE